MTSKQKSSGNVRRQKEAKLEKMEAKLEKMQAELERVSEEQLSHMGGGKAAKAGLKQKTKVERTSGVVAGGRGLPTSAIG
jgi:hypothetical protein